MRSTNTALSWPTPRRQRVALLDGGRGGLSSVAAALVDDGYCVDHFGTAEDALDGLNERAVEVLVVDVVASGHDGGELCATFRREPSFSRLALVAIVEHSLAKVRTLADVVLTRPFDVAELFVGIERALLRAERRAVSSRFEETERLTVLGTLAASIGHELNNPLAFALGNLELVNDALAAFEGSVEGLLQGGELGTEQRQTLARRLDLLRACFQDGRAGLQRVQTMVGDLACLTRPRSAEHRLVDVRRVLESCLRMAKGQIADRATVTCEYGDVARILGDEARLGQLFVNLLVNAAQAITPGRASSNRIHVAVYEESNALVVEIEDTGGGMSKTHLSRIFEPFFSTKAEHGTGLGLSICRDIVHEHGGKLEVASELGRGSRFSVRFPSNARRQ
jgi:signal transduction histidine kinase